MAANLELVIEALDRASPTLDHVDKKIGGLGPTASKAALAVGVLGSVALAGGLVAGLGAAVTAASGFEAQMSAVKAVSGATKDEMDLLSAAALRIGKDTAFSASQAAGAIEELVKAGISIEEVLGGAADAAVALAAAGGVTIPEAAVLAANAMNQFGIAAKDMPKIVDLIAGAANASAIDMREFGFSLQMVGAVANIAGVSFDDTATAIALMGNAGIKGSDAGTSLKTMLLGLIPETNKEKEAFRKLGIITAEGANRFLDAEGKMKSLADISAILKEGTGKLSDAQATMALKTAFGTDAIRAAAVMAGAGAEGFQTLNAEMLKTSAADVAKTRMDNMKGSMEQLKGSLETAAIIIGMAVLPAIRNIVDGFTGATNFIISSVLPVLGDFGHYLKAIVADGDPLNDWLSHLPGFLQPVAVGLGEVINFMRDQGIPALKEFGGFIRDTVIPALKDFIANDVAPKVEAFAKALASLWPIPLREIGGFLKDTILPKLQELGGWLADHKELIGAIGIAFATWKLAQIALGVVSLASKIPLLITAIQAMSAAMLTPPMGIIIVLAALAAAAFLIYKNWDEIWPKIKATWDTVSGAVSSSMADFKDWILDHWKAIVMGILAIVFPPGAGLFYIITHWGEVKDKVTDIVTDLTDWLKDKWQDFRDWFVGPEGIIPRIRSQAVAIFEGMRDAIIGVFKAMPGIVRGIFNGIIDLLNRLIDGINTVIQGFNKLPGPDIPEIPRVPHLAQGVRNFPGGLAIVGERGPELVALPRGSSVFSAQDTRQLAADNTFNINITINGPADGPTVRRAARDGVYEALRARGLMP